MARPGISYMAVEEAISLLVGQGRNPTIEQIRHLLGTGSSTTIANHFKRWKDLQLTNTLQAVKDKPPQELMALVRGLWERMIGQSAEKISDVENEYLEVISSLQQQLAKYQRNNKRWQQLYHAWHQHKSDISVENIQLKNIITELEQARQSSQQKLDIVMEQARQKQTRIDELHRLHLQAQSNLEHFRATTREQRLEEQARYQTTLQVLEVTTAQLIDAQARNKSLSDALAKLKIKQHKVIKKNK